MSNARRAATARLAEDDWSDSGWKYSVMAGAGDLKDRIQRAASWLRAADRLPPAHAHEIFVFHYIALNAMYGRRQYEGSRTDTRDDLDRFLERVADLNTLDTARGGSVLEQSLKQGRPPIEALVLDYFLIDRLFRGASATAVREQARRDAQRANLQLIAGDFIEVLRIVAYRLRVLRNRVMHGCVTHGPKSKGLPSIARGARVLKVIAPALLQLMIDHGHRVRWEPIPYPRVEFEDPSDRLDPD